jgi:hypothetical protein
MEESRLKVMDKPYNEADFKKLIKDTKKLKIKLARQIDHTRLGVCHEDILSAFDIKILYIFQKYGPTHPYEIVKANTINGIKMYKNRLLRVLYQKKNSISKSSIEDHPYLERIPEEVENRERDIMLNAVHTYMMHCLEEDAYTVFQIDLNPPPFILNRLVELGKKKVGIIPAYLVVEYMGLEVNPKNIAYINSLRRSIADSKLRASEFFSRNPLMSN